ncbi:hypothetical protein BATDEDRAFT_22068 [Batrachochytrium dendrobatidis JAM81]|uniref:Uncharacterized protein n=1 Tax=Batrachochytrium dendrobatidis (strain JAM81 / FGSC 10211) TaxID=684364 RepID=F4NS54_BATDJ|nr:uncharacterized protein BATDEDRAFT_22068 [Batrachochytrium dendrobatidis JAM81]EGF84225.1 hypothetical protein BATDEDRAFT_22068 [Batrachochytrium dendrobatidis JAM81]|eukprot:XP_006675459.1 hypothetical protein BATDEDRAFT_22068 [Batrachochytrium dendrobatidis JAM81]
MIDDLSIEPLQGQKSILHGYAGVTNQMAYKGTVSFKTTKDAKVLSLTLELRGSIHTALSSEEGHFVVQQDILSSALRILDPTTGSTPEIDIKGKGPTILVPKGTPAFEFAIDVPNDIAQALPVSYMRSLPPPTGAAADAAKAFATELATASKNDGGATLKKSKTFSSSSLDETTKKNWNGGKISYKLTATLEVLQTILLISSRKVYTVTEEIDFPRVDAMAVARSVHTNTGRLMQGSDNYIDYKFELDRTIFGIGQPVKVNIISLIPKEFKHSIARVTVNLVQIEKIRAVRDQSLERPHCYKQCIQKSILDSTEIERPSKGFKKFMTTVSKKIEPWRGETTVIVETAHRKLRNDPKYKAIDSIQSFDSEFVTVTHQIELRVKIANLSEIMVYSVPVRFFDIDGDTRHWVLNNADCLTGGDVTEENEDAKSGYIFDEDDLPYLDPPYLDPPVIDTTPLTFENISQQNSIDEDGSDIDALKDDKTSEAPALATGTAQQIPVAATAIKEVVEPAISTIDQKDKKQIHKEVLEHKEE